MEFRDFNSPDYKAWRLKVFKRDFFTCRLCCRKESLQAHHIRRWADCVELRHSVSNGITLCDICHTSVKDREDEYAPLFLRIIGQKPKSKMDLDNFIEARRKIRQL